MRLSQGTVALFAFLLVAQPALAVVKEDAGIGGDASDAKASPTALPAYAGYRGGLDPGTDQDWFSVGTISTGPTCILMDARANTGIGLSLTITSGNVSRELSTESGTGGWNRLALASMGVEHTRAGLLARGTPTNYDLRLQRLSPGQMGPGDGGSGADAGATTATAVRAPDQCFAGQIELLQGDSVDLYSFTVNTSREVVVSLAGANSVSASIVDAVGTVVASGITPGEAEIVALPSAGTYYMSMSAASPSSYVIGLVGPDDPPGSGCRPTCMLN